eukprot:6498763-Heterocapsa_arctica.AAC.1
MASSAATSALGGRGLGCQHARLGGPGHRPLDRPDHRIAPRGNPAGRGHRERVPRRPAHGPAAA